jgi:hypothetical protein
MNEPKKIPLSWIIFGGALALGLILQLFRWLSPGPSLSLLPPAEDLIQTATLEDAARMLGKPIPAPKETAGAAVYVVGMYPTAAPNLPVGTVDIVYAKDGNRFADLLIRPGISLEEEQARYQNAELEEVAIGNATGVFLRLPRQYLECQKATKERPVGVCQLTRLILFERDGALFSLAADGTHATDGELLTIARSIQND